LTVLWSVEVLKLVVASRLNATRVRLFARLSQGKNTKKTATAYNISATSPKQEFNRLPFRGGLLREDLRASTRAKLSPRARGLRAAHDRRCAPARHHSVDG